MNASPAEFEAWVGRSETAHETLVPTPLLALAATLDRPAPPVETGAELPPLWHWLYFLPRPRAGELGPDGHPRRGDFLPPVPLPRRMWAGSRLEFRAPLRVSDRVTRVSTIDEITAKEGRSGPLVFVKVRHELRCNGAAEAALVEHHDIVYRAARRADELPLQPQAAPVAALWQRQIVPDPVLLFRYSALTFNGHRIHYDRSYATGVEGYPGLVVHGPLLATLLLDLLDRHAGGARLAGFAFKAVRPTFDLRPFRVHGQPQADGKTVRLWASDDEGWLTLDATATLR
jgi:3-methylfumaryl-CoA hydratase